MVLIDEWFDKRISNLETEARFLHLQSDIETRDLGCK